MYSISDSTCFSSSLKFGITTWYCSYSAVEGVSGVIDDWCGGAFASGFGTLGGLVVWGGGHNGYFGSELYVFDLESQLWVRHT